MSIRKTAGYMVLIAVLAGITGCTTARMKVPTALQGVSEMPVTGRKAFRFNESFQFAPYSVVDVKRGWTKGSSWGLMGFSSGHKNQQYEFTLHNAKNVEWKAQCATKVSKRELEQNMWGGELTVELTAATAFVCTFHCEKTGDDWKMLLSRKTGHAALTGTLTDGATSITVTGTRSLEGSSIELSTATGYTFLMNNAMVGAVQVINTGAVWILPSSTEEIQQILANASAALILYDDIGED